MKKLIFFGLLAFLCGALYFAPLAFVAPYLSKFTKDITFQDPQGTIWNGQVEDLRVQQHYLGQASWKVAPLKSLQSLSLKSQFALKSDDIKANGLAGINLDQQLILNNTQFDINAAYINTLQNRAKLSGTFNGFVKKATLKQRQVPLVDGIINWQNGSLDTPIKLAKGDYRAVIKPVNNKDLSVALSSKEAPIELSGDVKLQHDWIVNSNIKTKSSNAGLMAMMKFSGKPQADGSVLIQEKTDLKPFLGIR